MNICLFTEREVSEGLPLPADDGRALHIRNVLKKGEGDTFAAGVIGGMAGTATITRIGAPGEVDCGAVYFSFEGRTDGKRLFPLEMLVGFPRPIQLKRLLRDMAALGVRAVRLAGTELGEKSYLKSTLAEEGQIHRMLYEGTVQAGGTHIPRNFVYRSVRECLDEMERSQEAEPLKIALDNIGYGRSLSGFLQENSPFGRSVVAAVGSERGWTDRERALLESRGFVRLGMGERVMRTETAATVAAAIILERMKCLE